MASPRDDEAPVVCSICIEPVFRNRSRAITQLKCGHTFHFECIYPVFNTQNGVMRCPNCRDVERWISLLMVPTVGYVPEGSSRAVGMVPSLVANQGRGRGRGRARANSDPLELTLAPGTFTARTADDNARPGGGGGGGGSETGGEFPQDRDKATTYQYWYFCLFFGAYNAGR